MIIGPDAPEPRSISKTSTGSTLASDANKFIKFDNGVSDITYTIEDDGTGGVTHPVDTEIFLYRRGTGEVTIGKGAGVTFEGPLGDNAFKLSGTKTAMAQIKKLAANLWLHLGAVKAV
jgi:hypothetical protein